MKKTPTTEKRTYQSELRAQQARATYARILDAAMAMLRDGARDLSYAALARAARVSVPTVYRHFPTRPELFEALYHRIEAQHGGAATAPSDLDGAVRAFFERYDGDAMRSAARLNHVWEFSRVSTVPRRRAWCAAFVDARVPGLKEPERTWLIDLAVLLISSAFAESARGYLDLDGSATGDRVRFALDALLAHARTLTQEDP